MHFSKLILIILVVISISACSGTINFKTGDPVVISGKLDSYSKTYNHDYDKTWKIIKNALFDEGYVTRSASKEGGIISTDFKTVNFEIPMWLFEEDVTLWPIINVSAPTEGSNHATTVWIWKKGSKNNGSSKIPEFYKEYSYIAAKPNSILQTSSLKSSEKHIVPLIQSQTINFSNGNRFSNVGSYASSSFAFSKLLFKSPDDLYFKTKKSRHQLQIRVSKISKNKTKVDLAIKNSAARFSRYQHVHNSFEFDFGQDNFIEWAIAVRENDSGWMNGFYYKRKMHDKIFGIFDKYLN